MKKMFALLLMILFLGGCFAQAESAESVYDVLTHLMNGRTFTLTVTAESEAEELANVIAQYGAVTCTLRQENDEILLTAACDGDAYLNATATKDGVRFDTNLIENGTFSSDTEMFRDIYNSLLDKRNMPRPDQYFILGDFRSYAEAQKRVEEAYKDEKRWAKMALLNTACSGKFTSDRTIQEYVDDIWHLDKVIVKEN